MDNVRENAGKKAAEVLLQAVNSFDRKSTFDGFSNTVCKDHPSLQQSVMSAFVTCCKKWDDAYKKGRYDGRNEGTVKLAHRIIQIIEEENLILPFI